MSQDLFWSAKELQRFKKEAMSQIEILVLTKSISFDDAKKELYQPKRELLNNSLNSVKESSSTTSSEDDYFIADTALALEEEEEDAENSLSSSSDLDDIEANLLYELQQSDYLRERGGKLKFSWAVF